MDEIFIQNPSLIVCGKRELTQRERPQAFIDAEGDRIAENTEMGREIMKSATASHLERV